VCSEPEHWTGLSSVSLEGESGHATECGVVTAESIDVSVDWRDEDEFGVRFCKRSSNFSGSQLHVTVWTGGDILLNGTTTPSSGSRCTSTFTVAWPDGSAADLGDRATFGFRLASPSAHSGDWDTDCEARVACPDGSCFYDDARYTRTCLD
jgi:hypothetical protein